MASIDRSAGYFQDPRGVSNRLAGILLLVFSLPLILLITAVMLLRFDWQPVFEKVPLSATDTGAQPAMLWRFRITDEDAPFSRFLEQSRLNLLPQLANVVRGEIAVSMAMR